MIDYRKYVVWQKSHTLVLKVYKTTAEFPKTEQYGIVSQINRAAVSIPTNIAEGCGRETQKELIRYLYISSGSTHELEYLILLSKDLNYISAEEANILFTDISEIKKMLSSLIRKVTNSITGS
ncbi:MAG TPA: four helix bundle protein [Flavobacterium sp.]|jgi:four helix bundle protein|nr:four helix bundle protein [Flavobacterium sp.]